MPPAGPAEAVRFNPSKVQGIGGAEEVAVYPDRLEVCADGRWQVFAFEPIAVGGDPRWWTHLMRRIGLRPPRGVVADCVYVRDPYPESYFHFYSEPRVTVYMPADGVPLYADSVFWRIHETLRAGGFAAEDPHYDRGRILTDRDAYARAHRSVPYGPPR